MPFFAIVGIAFGFIAVVVAIGYESYFRLPAGVQENDYVTVLRREADSGRAGLVTLNDVRGIAALAPEVAWAYAQYHPNSLELKQSDGTSAAVASRYVSANYLQLLGVAPALGRIKAAADGRAGAVISSSLWQRHYGSDAEILGQLLDTEMWGPLPIVGVAGGGFGGLFFEKTDVWILGRASSIESRPGNFITFSFPTALVGVMQRPTRPAALRSLLDAYTFASTSMEHDRLEFVSGLEMLPDARRDMHRQLAWLALVVALLLLQVFLSLVDRLLAEHHSRREEQAVRLSVGATPADMFAEMSATHAAWLLVAGLAAALAGFTIADILASVEPFSLYIGEFSTKSLAWGFGSSALLLLLAFLLSAAHVSRLAARTGRGISGVALQSASVLRLARTALLFVAAASLLIVSSLAARHAEDPRASTGVANADALMLGVIYYGDLSTAVELLAAHPAVEAFAQAEMLPLLAESVRPANRALLQGRAGLEDAMFYRNGVAPGYFDVLGIEVLAGRVFDDAAKSEVVLGRAAAQSLAGSAEDALGQAFAYVTDTAQGRAQGTQTATVVGVVRDVAYGPVHEAPRRVFYRMVEDPGDGLFVVREAAGDADVALALQQHPDVEDAYRIGTVAEIFDELVLAGRSAEAVLAVAAALALVLALAGVVLSLAKEMAAASGNVGVRLALGATPADVAIGFWAQPIVDLAVVAVLLTALAFLGKLAAPTFMSVVELWLVALVIPALAVVVVLVVYRLATGLARGGTIYALLGQV